MGERKMYKVHMENCNNITIGDVEIEEGKLNIKYGINGTGKTTLSKAILCCNEVDKLKNLKTFDSVGEANVTISPCINKVLVFDEDFVNQVVFQENEVIGQSFEIFIKTPTYDAKKEQLDNHLNTLKKLMEENEEINGLREKLQKLTGKFSLTTSGKLSKKGALGSLLSKSNLYNIPNELEEYRPFINDKDNNINWIAWKTQGDKFDTIEKCPFCAEKLPEIHDERKKIFAKTYKKSDSQNLKEVVDLLESLSDYLEPTQFDKLMSYIKDDTPEDTIQIVILKLYTELDLLIKKFDAIINFGKKQIVIADIGKLDLQINNMEIPKLLLEYFGGKHIDEIVDKINENVSSLKDELGILKKEMGELKGVIQATIYESQKDINEFLKTAGINYELEIQAEDEANSRTILKQCFSESKTDVTNIRNHLSWGEKNAFSLILFMYYAKNQNPDIIILDDPISSFDSNKKFAILHRMFKKDVGKKDVSLCGKTVLLLTHDFEPITDFIVVGKLPADLCNASFIWNYNGKVQEKDINPSSDVKIILDEAQQIARNSYINIVSRIAFLRKYCELCSKTGELDVVYEVLSCLIHGQEIKRKVGNNTYVDIDQHEIDCAIACIKNFIPNFEYNLIKDTVYTEEGIKNLYNIETNAYLKIQLFRAFCEISEKVRIAPIDGAWYKFIDETYHIENDYLHYLDVLKFNIVPYYITKIVDDMMKTV